MAKDYEEYRFEDPEGDREYVIGADWAQSQDLTVITVADVTSSRSRWCTGLGCAGVPTR